jgi:mannose-6-phosphate isomerase-like protein (cupin superfamily)
LRLEEIVCPDLNAALERWRNQGFRLDSIYPADDPHTAVLSNGERKVRLTTRPEAPGPPTELPPFRPEFVLTRADNSAGVGRAGMLYRDLIPNRLGGRYIASHITIPEGGPVADWVHFHRIAFQFIYVRRGSVRVVYEDQGEPFVMNAGDLVLQPPEIRHRVLESSPGLEVIEITCPALHETCADHELALPNGLNHEREFGGQRFLRHIAAQTPWTRFRGGEAQETGIRAATGGLAEVRTIRRDSSDVMEFPPHDGELLFGFVLAGSARLSFGDTFDLGPADAFVIPPGEAWTLSDVSKDFRLLHVAGARPESA